MGGLSYKVKKRSFGFDTDKTEKYVATAVRSSTVSFDKMIEQVSLRSGISKASCRAVMEKMVEAAGTWLLEGHGVSVGDIGYLKPAITSKNSEVPGGEKNLRKRVLFQPSKSFKHLIDTMPLERIGPATDSEETPDPKPDESGGGPISRNFIFVMF